jgi:hypothetical protein
MCMWFTLLSLSAGVAGVDGEATVVERATTVATVAMEGGLEDGPIL